MSRPTALLGSLLVALVAPLHAVRGGAERGRRASGRTRLTAERDLGGPWQRGVAGPLLWRRRQEACTRSPRQIHFVEEDRQATSPKFDVEDGHGRHIRRADAKWIGHRLGMLSERQIRDAFRAAGYSRGDVGHLRAGDAPPHRGMERAVIPFDGQRAPVAVEAEP